MIAVSEGWKKIRNQTLLPETFVEISLTVTEPGLQGEAVVTGNDVEEFSSLEAVTGVERLESESYTTLDYGLWGLDGATGYSDGSPKNQGYVNSNYSDSDGSLLGGSRPTLNISFKSIHEVLIPGITITWSENFGGWATDFRVTAYNSTGIVSSKTVVGNTDIVSVVNIDLIDYTGITIEVLKWSHPYQRVRLTDVRLGISRVFTKADMLSFEHNQSVDLLSATLPESSISFSLRNENGQWNPDNPKDAGQYLLEEQELQVRYGMDINGTTEWIKGGTFWLSEWNTPANGMEASFTARDAFEFMRLGYMGSTSGTLYDIAIAAFEESDLPVMPDGSPRYLVDESLKSIEVDFLSNPGDYVISELLQMVAHAGNCVLYQDRDGRVRIEPWLRRYSDYMITPDISYTHPEYSINKPLRAVEVSYGDDLKVTIDAGLKGEVQTVTNPLITTEENALRVGELVKGVLGNRKVITGEFRADLRLDALDNIIVVSKYASNIIGVTNVTYSTTGGSFKGTYTGRVVSVKLDSVSMNSGEFYVGEI